MSRLCLVCTHESVSAVNRDVGQKIPLVEIASHYKGFTKSSLHRHVTKCLGIKRRETTPNIPASRVPLFKGAGLSRPGPSEDGRCKSCLQLIGPSEEKLEPKALLRRAERSLYYGETIVMQAFEDKEARLALQGLDRVKAFLEQLMKTQGMMGPDSVTLIDQRRLSVFPSDAFQNWTELMLRIAKAAYMVNLGKEEDAIKAAVADAVECLRKEREEAHKALAPAQEDAAIEGEFTIGERLPPIRPVPFRTVL